MNTDIPPITPTAPLHAGKRESNFIFLNQFRTHSQVTPVKSGFSTPLTNKYKGNPKRIPLPTTPPIREAELVPFEAKNLKDEIKNLVDPESVKLSFAIFFFILSLIFLSLFLLEIHPEIFLLLSILFFSLASYSFSKYYMKHKNVGKSKVTNKQPLKFQPRRFPKNNGKRPSEMFAIYGPTNQNQILSFNTDISIDLYPQFVNADRPSASMIKLSSIIQTPEAQTDSLANETLKKLELKLQIFNQYTSNMKNFIVNSILSKIDLTSEKPYLDMMLSIPNYDRKYIIQRIRELAGSPYLAGHLAEKGDNQIILHILSVWLSYLITDSREDKHPPLVFAQKYLAIGGKEPKIESDQDIYIVANNQYNSFYIISRPLKKDNSSEASSVERFYAYPGKDSMYSSLTLFFYIIKKKFDFLLDGADLQEPPYCMHRIYELTHLT